ncbi:MAG TPA: hypothetical protein VHV29_06770 [Terriglobales bacterium]|jgi:hypothetical protein|nr:hypothetical protein [Terriglobales bacterium]
MSWNRRPVAILLVSYLYMAVGAVGFVVNFTKLRALQQDSIWIELTESLAFIAGLYMFRGRNWARWLALGWMAFHVAISFPVIRQVLTHSIMFALIAWALFRPDARRYFTSLKPDSE